jgi:CBS domain-containing protein
MRTHDNPNRGGDEPIIEAANEAYFDDIDVSIKPGFDQRLLESPVAAMARRVPIVFSKDATVTDAVRAMQRDHRGCVLITEDGTRQTALIGIFTERDVLFRIVDRGRNPQELTLGDVMVRDPEVLPRTAPVAWVLNKMSVGGFRHVPVVDEECRPVFIVSVKDIVDFLVASFPAEVLNLPPDFDCERYRERDGA